MAVCATCEPLSKDLFIPSDYGDDDLDLWAGECVTCGWGWFDRKGNRQEDLNELVDDWYD